MFFHCLFLTRHCECCPLYLYCVISVVNTCFWQDRIELLPIASENAHSYATYDEVRSQRDGDLGTAR